jgi:hypothetical protein
MTSASIAVGGGGNMARALLDPAGIRPALLRAVNAARRRSVQLSREAFAT